MHHFLGVFRNAHAFVGAIFPAHQHFHLGADRLLVKLKRLVTASIKEQIWLNLHACPLSFFALDREDCAKLTDRNTADVWRRTRATDRNSDQTRLAAIKSASRAIHCSRPLAAPYSLMTRSRSAADGNSPRQVIRVRPPRSSKITVWRNSTGSTSSPPSSWQ